jgi:protein SCO1/2
MTSGSFSRAGRRGLIGLLTALAVPVRAQGHPGHAHSDPEGSSVASVAAERLRGRLPDARVTDANGRRRRLVSEVIAGRVVAVDFVLTGCSSLCPVVSAAMAGAQDLLATELPAASRRGAAALLSIGLDPFSDTPEELARYAARFGPGAGWSFVSLPHRPLDEVLRSLGGPEPGVSDHAPVVLVLDVARAEVRRLVGLPGPEAIARTVRDALQARG